MTPVDDGRVVVIPARISGLGPLSQNLWWSWKPRAEALYRDLDPFLFESVQENPVLLLQRVAPARLQRAATDAEYLRQYDAVMAEFGDLLHASPATTWVGRHQPELVERPVAYFSAEFGVHPSLPIYSGGLGVLAGDHAKSASDLGLPLVGVSLLYRQGYLRQRLTHDGWQLDVTPVLEPGAEPTTLVCEPDGTPLTVELALANPAERIRLHIWCVQVGRVPLYLLDADVEGNPEWTRAVSSRLYGGDQEHRLRQEKILGIGGVRALRAMGIDPIYWHGNEGHAGFHLLERAREWVAEGCSFAEAAERVTASSVFTSHTPVPAGHDVFPPQLMDRYFGFYWPQLGLNREEFLALGHHDASGDGFNMTALSMRLSGYRNGVSARHGEITRAMWHDLWPGVEPALIPITSITNGVHLPTWIAPPLQSLFARYLPEDLWREMQDDDVWERVLDIPDDELWAVRAQIKQVLLEYLNEYTRERWASGEIDPKQVMASGPFLEPEPLTIGFARRFATYKRATLIFTDPDRLARILTNPERPVQLIFAGKAHPADDGGKRLIQEICWRSLDPRFQGRIAFAEDYDMRPRLAPLRWRRRVAEQPARPAGSQRHLRHEGGRQWRLERLNPRWLVDRGLERPPRHRLGNRPVRSRRRPGGRGRRRRHLHHARTRSRSPLLRSRRSRAAAWLDSPLQGGDSHPGPALLLAADGDRLHQPPLRPRLDRGGALEQAAGRGQEDLGRKSLDNPAVSNPAIAQPIMQPVGAALPELDPFWLHAVAAPGGGHRHGAFTILGRESGERSFQLLAAGDRLALMGEDSPQAAAERPALEIGLRFFLADPLGGSGNAHLPLQLGPEEGQRRARIRGEIASLGAGVVRVEDKPPLVESLQQHDARGGDAIAGSSGQDHRIGLEPPGLTGLAKPAAKLRHGIGIEILLIESIQRVIAPHFRQAPRHG